MNKTRKGLLTAGSIISIVGSAFAIVGAFVLFLFGAMCTEDIMKDSYLTDPAYTYFENVDGSYYFTTIEDGEEIVIDETDVELIAKVATGMFVVMGIVVLGLSAAKLVLSIRILITNNRDKYSKGCVIALLVLSALNSNILEVVLLAVAMCQKDNPPQEENKNELNNSDVTLSDM